MILVAYKPDWRDTCSSYAADLQILPVSTVDEAASKAAELTANKDNWDNAEYEFYLAESISENLQAGSEFWDAYNRELDKAVVAVREKKAQLAREQEARRKNREQQAEKETLRRLLEKYPNER